MDALSYKLEVILMGLIKQRANQPQGEAAIKKSHCIRSSPLFIYLFLGRGFRICSHTKLSFSCSTQLTLWSCSPPAPYFMFRSELTGLF